MTGILRPVELEIEGFRSFVDKSLIKFPDIKRGAVLINGKYKDGSTSSGSGKSSILMAMAFALDFCDVPATELKSWYGKKINVRFRLADDNNVYDIIRNPKLKLVVNGKEFEGTSEGAKDKLSEILKASPELVKSLTYRPQREKGIFLNGADKKLKEFLTKILELDPVEEAVDGLARELVAINSTIAMAESSISQLQFQSQSSIVSEESIAAAQESLRAASERLASLGDVSEADRNIRLELSNIEIELGKIYKANMEVQSAKNQNLAIRQNIELKQREITTLKQGMCPTCEREWNKSQSLIDIKNNEIMQLVNSMKSNVTLIKAAEPLLDPAFQTQLSNRKSQLHSDLGRLSAPINDAFQTKNLAQSNLDNLLRLKSHHAGILSQIQVKQKELEEAKINAYITEHSFKLLGRSGFLGSIFDEVLSEIKMRSNDLISYMPNINTFSLDVSSSSVTQAGKVNKKIKIAMFKDGLEKSLKSLSGGQITSSELCTDLAVSETIRSRSGSRLGWVALDEAMDGLDVETKIAALEVIKAKVEGLIIVVDHSTEIKEAFDQVIEVEFDGKRSYVV